MTEPRERVTKLSAAGRCHAAQRLGSAGTSRSAGQPAALGEFLGGRVGAVGGLIANAPATEVRSAMTRTDDDRIDWAATVSGVLDVPPSEVALRRTGSSAGRA